MKALFQAAVERPAEERDAFLTAATGDDAALRREVESLLASDTSDVSFLDRLPVASASAACRSPRPTGVDGSPRGLTPSSPRVFASVPTTSSPRSAPAAWARCIARATRSCGATVAIKVLPAAWRATRTVLLRFEREARAVAALNHPHIVTIFSTEEADGVRFLTMELVEGRTLDQLIPRGGVSLAQFFDIAMALADALSAAHRKHITHRDLKPANVMVSDDGRVKVLDFGLARSAEPQTRTRRRGRDAPAAHEGGHDPGHDAVHVAGTDRSQTARSADATSSRWASCCTRWRPARGRLAAIRRRR